MSDEQTINEEKPTLGATIKSFPSSYWTANVMEIFERMAWYGFYALSSLYMCDAVSERAADISRNACAFRTSNRAILFCSRLHYKPDRFQRFCDLILKALANLITIIF